MCLRVPPCAPSLPPRAGSIDASLLITTRNRAADLAVTLGELERQDTGGLDWELIVVDNGSSDSTPRVLSEARARLPLRALEHATPGKNGALNLALPQARGALLVFTDDDVTPDLHWLERLCGAAQRWPGDSIFGGPIFPEFPPNTPEFLTAPDFSYASVAFARYAPDAPEGPLPQAPFGGNMALRAELFSEFSFNTQIGPAGSAYAQGSEYELTRRMNDRGYRNIFVPDAPVHHRIRADQVDPEWLLKRAFRFGRGLERVHPTPERRSLGSVPFKLWYELGLARLSRTALALGSAQRRLEAALHHEHLRGKIFEHRQNRGAAARAGTERDA